MWDWLSGKKTYIVAVVGVIVTFLAQNEIIPPNYVELIWGLLGALGLASLRAGISKGGGK